MEAKAATGRSAEKRFGESAEPGGLRPSIWDDPWASGSMTCPHPMTPRCAAESTPQARTSTCWTSRRYRCRMLLSSIPR